jgi:2C-methyl-D-erythritol 2,4-cyclodiphosphate synthase
MTNSRLAHLLTQFAVELEVASFVPLNSFHDIGRTILNEGMADAVTHALADALENVLVGEIHAKPKNMPLEGVHAIATRMFLKRAWLEMSEHHAGIVDLKLNLEALKCPHQMRCL